ncbi:membrane protein [Clostridium botulinum C/D str. BKT12695]|nr:membrane protein [Clostridium botulinum C/D str. BKT12695]
MKKVSIILASIVCVVLLLGPLSILRGLLYPSVYKNQYNRVHLNTLNTTRVLGENSQDVGVEVSKILYPAEDKEGNLGAIIVLQSDNWQDALSMMPVVRKYNAVLMTVGNSVSKKTYDYINEALPKGINDINGTQLFIFGKNIENLKAQLKDVKLKSTYLSYKTTDELQRYIYGMPNILNNEKYAFLVKDDNPLASIPSATWIAKEGGMLLYADKDNKLYESSKEILRNENIKNVYVLADKTLDGDGILKPFKAKVNRLVAFKPESFAVKFARFNDEKNSVGWASDRNRNNEGHNYILCSKANPMMAVLASQLSTKGRTGPMLWTESKGLSPITENYLWRMKPNYWVGGAEGPYNNVWIIGSNNILDYGTQSRVDYTQGINSYEMMGHGGVSGIEALCIVSILISIFGAIWTALHLFLRMRRLSLLVKIMWILTVLLLGALGLWIYIISYVDSPWMNVNNKVICMRPVWKQVLVATVMTLSFGGASIIAIQYIMTKIGLPIAILPEKSGVHLLGNPIIILMIVSYILAFILSVYFFVPDLFIEIKNISYIHAKKEAFVPVVVSITSIFIGIALSMWWLSVVYAPRIPEEDYILWWGFMHLSVVIGGIVSYIPNWLLVKFGKELGVV